MTSCIFESRYAVLALETKNIIPKYGFIAHIPQFQSEKKENC